MSNQQSFKIINQEDVDYCLAVRGGKLVINFSNPGDPYQRWIKNDYIDKKDQEGQQAFALINEATKSTIKHDGTTGPVSLVPFKLVDGTSELSSVLWSMSKDSEKDFKKIRRASNLSIHITPKDFKIHDGRIMEIRADNHSSAYWKFVQEDVDIIKDNDCAENCDIDKEQVNPDIKQLGTSTSIGQGDNRTGQDGPNVTLGVTNIRGPGPIQWGPGFGGVQWITGGGLGGAFNAQVPPGAGSLGNDTSIGGGGTGTEHGQGNSGTIQCVFIPGQWGSSFGGGQWIAGGGLGGTVNTQVPPGTGSLGISTGGTGTGTEQGHGNSSAGQWVAGPGHWGSNFGGGQWLAGGGLGDTINAQVPPGAGSLGSGIGIRGGGNSPGQWGSNFGSGQWIAGVGLGGVVNAQVPPAGGSLGSGTGIRGGGTGIEQGQGNIGAGQWGSSFGGGTGPGQGLGNSGAGQWVTGPGQWGSSFRGGQWIVGGGLCSNGPGQWGSSFGGGIGPGQGQGNSGAGQWVAGPGQWGSKFPSGQWIAGGGLGGAINAQVPPGVGLLGSGTGIGVGGCSCTSSGQGGGNMNSVAL